MGPPAAASGRPVLEVDLALLLGFTFSCRPDCGLCCFTSPRLEGDDEARLRAAVPHVRVAVVGGEPCVAARPNGGACQFLSRLRCTAHDARPAPCREFPISVHIGRRLQATIVLSCPGVALDPLFSRSPSETTSLSSTFEQELASLRRRLTPTAERRRSEAERRRSRFVRALSQEGRWVDEEEVRRKLASRRLIPSEREYLPVEPPMSEEGVERLPMYFDGREGPVAFSQGLGGWEALELLAEGDSRPVGIAVAPATSPSLEADAEALLAGYLRYWLARDAFLAAVTLTTAGRAEVSVLDVALDDLHAIGSDVLARAAFRAKLRGETGIRLARRDVELGIRATDQDWLDRPTWGSRL